MNLRFPKAIMACSDAGGGTVLVPTGRYLTGAIELQAHVHLEIWRRRNASCQP